MLRFFIDLPVAITMKLLSTKNWSRYSRNLANNREELYKYRRIILLSQFTLFGTVIGIIHALEDLVDGLLFMPLMDFTMAAGIFLSYLLNENGKHKVARIGLLAFLNIFFFIYCSFAPHELGIFLFYFPWIGLAAVVFETDENLERFFFIGFSIALLIILFATKFHAFGDIEFQAVGLGRSFVINLITSVVVLAFFIVFMVRMNDKSERKLFELADEIKQKNTTLEKTNRELDRFLYSTSHDLRAPLMSVKGLVMLAQQEASEVPLNKYLDLMEGRIERLDNFIKDIIDYARNGKIILNPEPVVLEELVNEVIGTLKFMEGADKITFVKDIEANLQLTTDKGRLLIVLNNLVSNAIKYAHPGGNCWVKIIARNTDHQLELLIADNGRGIANEHLSKVFDMFYRATEHSKGSGLGLYIVKEAIHRVGGTIHVQSELDKGTTFTIQLPIVLVVPEAALIN